MAKTNITQYSSTPSSNTDINNINIDENCPASGLNNAIRELMAHLKNVDTGSQALTAFSVTGSATVNDGITVTDSGASPIIANRTTSDGTIVDLQKDGTTVGSIGSRNSDLTIGNVSIGLQFFDNIDLIAPMRPDTNALRDGDIDLGIGNARFKDLYLSGGVYLGGTGSANYLDDYEEGTFTPTLVYSGTNTPTVNSALGTYTKIGQVVHVQIYFQWDENGSTGNLKAGALPFTSVNGLNRAIPSMLSFGLTGLTENVSVTGFVQMNTTEIPLFLNNNGASSLSATYTDSNQDLYITVTYTVA